MTVAIVGASAICALGPTWRGLGQKIANGQTAFERTEQLASSFPDVLGSEVRAIPRPASPTERNARKLMSRGALLGSLAANAAIGELAARGDHKPYIDLGYYLGVGASGGAMEQLRVMLHASLVPEPSAAGDEDAATPSLAFSLPRFGDAGLKRCNPLFAFQLMNNFTLCHGAILEDIRGPNAALFSRGSGTVAALGEAIYAVESGACRRALAGGADSALHPVTLAEIERHGYRGMRPGEGAALLAVQADARDALAYIDDCTWLPAAQAAPTHRAAASRERSPLEQLVRAWRPPVDVIVLAPWGTPARDALAQVLDRTCPDIAVLDISRSLGDALAATPALAWAAALDLLVAGKARCALVISAGIDGDIGVVRLSSPGHQNAPKRQRKPALDARGDDRIPVITGVGVVSAFGVGVERFWDGLAAGQSAIKPITWFDASTFPTRVAGQVGDADHARLRQALSGRMATDEHRDRKLLFGLAAALEASRQAGWGTDVEDAWLSLALGLETALLADFAPMMDMGDHPRGRDARLNWRADGDTGSPRLRFRTPVDLCARAIQRELGLSRRSFIHVSACAAGALSVAHAASLIARGATTAVVCGAADSMINPLGLGGMCRLGAPSPRIEPSACRPFDRRRDGLVIGEGAAVFTVESRARALARGAAPLARILGWGSTQDGYKATAPRPDGSAAAAAMTRALQRAGCRAQDIGYINAHGTGTRLNDPTEARAIADALGPCARAIPISSIKGAVGHLMAASGAVELAACLLAFRRDMLPGTAHLQHLDPECATPEGPLAVIRQPMRANVQFALSNSFGFGGQNATVILGREP